MANAIYDLARQSFLSQNPSIDLDTDDIVLSLVRNTYAPNLSTDQYVAICGTRVADSANLSAKTVTFGVFDAADAVFTVVPVGLAIQYLVMWKNTGNPATSPLIALFDTGTGLPVTPGGGDINVVWDGGANKIFKI